MSTNLPKLIYAVLSTCVFAINTSFASPFQDISENKQTAEKAVATVRKVLNTFVGKRFLIDTKVIDDSGNYSDKVYRSVNAEIHGNRIARFCCKTDGEYKNGTKFALLREWLYQEDGQSLRARCYLLADNKQSRVNLIGIKDWNAVDPTNLEQLWFLGYFWSGERYLDINDPELLNKVKVQFRDGALIFGIDPNEIVKICLNADGTNIESIMYSVPSRVPTRTGQFDSIELKLFYDSKNEIEHYELNALNAEFNGSVAYFLRDIEVLTDPRSYVDFDLITVPDNAEVHVLYTEEKQKCRYHLGHFHPVLDRQSYLRLQELLDRANRKKGVLDSKLSTEDFVLDDYLGGLDTGMHCGAYSLSACAAILGKEISPSQLLRSDSFVQDLGTSISAINECAEKNDLYTVAVRNADYTFLDDLRWPVLLHCGKQLQKDETSHWVVFTGKQKAGYGVLDLPHDEVVVPAGVLQASWDGTAIIVSDTPVLLSTLRTRWWFWFLLRNFLPTGAILVMGTLIIRLCSKKSTKCLATQCFVVCGVCILSTAYWLATSPLSYVRNAVACSLISAKYDLADADFDIIENTSDLATLNKTGCIIVDSRLPAAFRNSHIEGAINLPVNATLLQIAQFSQDIPKGNAIVVYCQDSKCVWSDRTASVIRNLGYKNVYVYRPGLDGLRRDSASKVALSN